MDEQHTSLDEAADELTQHAMLVVWGLYAQQIGLVRALAQVKLKQKVRDHDPQTKVLEFLVAILAGLPHLQDISRSAHPLDQDRVVAEAWDQPAWADYSGVSRTLQRLTETEVQAIEAALTSVSQPFIDQETALALEQSGRLVYDIDLTGRPVSSTSTTYPDAAFGHMGDVVALGYQAALVSLHSPTYRRLWLANQLHPGDTVSSTQTQALVHAAEVRTGLRPRRRTELVAWRLTAAQTLYEDADARYQTSYDQLKTVQDQEHDTLIELREWQGLVRQLEAEYADSGRSPTAHCKLTRARQKVAMYEQRWPRTRKALATAQRRLQRHERLLVEARAEVERLRLHQAHLEEENRVNPQPIQAVLRLDSGFASRENIAWLMEMGYDIYTKARSSQLAERLASAVTPESVWQRVGGNASLTAWADTTADDHFIYPVNVALAHYQLGERTRRSVLVHYGDDPVTQDLDGWFHTYNGRQTIEAGIKEGKNVFQMHHLKVRSPQALLLQEHFACFAANFVRFAALWLTQQEVTIPPLDTTSVKHLVQVCAHTSAWVRRHGDVWLLTFAEQSLYAGRSLRFGIGPIQLPLPLFRNVRFCHF